MRDISVMGAGYVDLVTAACFAEVDHKANLLEINLGKAKALGHGVLPISEPSLLELRQRNGAVGTRQIESTRVKPDSDSH